MHAGAQRTRVTQDFGALHDEHALRRALRVYPGYPYLIDSTIQLMPRSAHVSWSMVMPTNWRSNSRN